ncbi:hypothetical protein [Arenibaculum pallidiluteum]|uniref:hypothetical protein n=1 Tax=Arenibaculum pallidiluteum TaxID=2812559 RepID=UPI001A966998|nr:hypothetical protein [Arenibaculum pallidiluteum]
METLTYLFVFVAVVALLLVFVALRWASSGLARVLIVALFALLLPAAYAAPASLLGRAKPVTLEWVNTQVKEASVLSATLIEGDAIYLTLRWNDAPSLYKMPWDRKLAEQLQQTMEESSRQGTQPMMRQPFEPSWDRQEPRFYTPPQPKMPDKPYAPGGQGGPGGQGPSYYEFRHPGQPA